jgi:hypothetical protein
MYRAFENIQEEHLRELNNSKQAFNENINTFVHTDIHSDHPCLKDIGVESTLKIRSHDILRHCDGRGGGDLEDYSKCIGFECLEGSFLFDPDTFNTSHNYAVLQENTHFGQDVFCTNNHQVFNNSTRRHFHTTPDETNSKYLVPDVPRLPELEYNICKLYNPPVDTKCSFP